MQWGNYLLHISTYMSQKHQKVLFIETWTLDNYTLYTKKHIPAYKDNTYDKSLACLVFLKSVSKNEYMIVVKKIAKCRKLESQ